MNEIYSLAQENRKYQAYKRHFAENKNSSTLDIGKLSFENDKRLSENQILAELVQARKQSGQQTNTQALLQPERKGQAIQATLPGDDVDDRLYNFLKYRPSNMSTHEHSETLRIGSHHMSAANILSENLFKSSSMQSQVHLSDRVLHQPTKARQKKIKNGRKANLSQRLLPDRPSCASVPDDI